MTRPLTRGGRFALLLIPIGVLPLIFLGQMARRSTSPSRTIPVRHLTSPQVHDWSNRHAIYSRTGTAQALDAARRDPRALTSWAEFDRGVAQRRLNAFAARSELVRAARSCALNRSSRDWSIYLGTGGTAETMFPAKFSFDVNATPSCTSDFIVFPVNAVPSATQPNIVAFNQLYSGGTQMDFAIGPRQVATMALLPRCIGPIESARSAALSQLRRYSPAIAAASKSHLWSRSQANPRTSMSWHGKRMTAKILPTFRM